MCAVVRLADEAMILYAEPGIEFPGQHYAFVVDDDTFDALLERIRARGTYWADPAAVPGQPDQHLAASGREVDAVAPAVGRIGGSRDQARRSS